MGTIAGSDGADKLTGTMGDDVIVAGGGDDIIILSSGHDIIDGGDGTFDQLTASMSDPRIFAKPSGARTYTVTADRVFDSSGVLDTKFSGIEYISIRTGTGLNFYDTGNFDDTFDVSGFAGSRGVSIVAGFGNDTMIGSAANDSFYAFLGANMVDGGDGDDRAQVAYKPNPSYSPGGHWRVGDRSVTI